MATGFHGRLVSALLLPILLTAAWVHFPNGCVFTSTGGGWEYPVFLAVASLIHALAGEGAVGVKTAAVTFRKTRHIAAPAGASRMQSVPVARMSWLPRRHSGIN